MKHFKVKIFFSLLALATAQHNLFAATIDNPNQAESGPGTVVDPNAPITAIPDPALVSVDPEMSTPTETPIEEKTNEQMVYMTCALPPEQPIANVTPPIRIPGSEFRKMVKNNSISYTIMNAFIKENQPKNFTGTIQSKDITTQIQALAAEDKLFHIKKSMIIKIKNNALSEIQKDMYENKNIVSTLSLFAENMPFSNKQHAEILAQAFPTNPAPNVRMAPQFYLIIIGDSRVPSLQKMQKIINKENKKANKKENKKENKKGKK